MSVRDRAITLPPPGNLPFLRKRIEVSSGDTPVFVGGSCRKVAENVANGVTVVLGLADNYRRTPDWRRRCAAHARTEKLRAKGMNGA